MLNRKEFIRYSRQLMLPKIGEAGQENLKSTRVAVVGLGGLGCPVVQYLAGAGVGSFLLIDDDRVELENLHRQLLFCEDDVGEYKVDIAAKAITRLNPAVQVENVYSRMDGVDLEKLFSSVDLVLDCTDSLASRLEMNRAAVATKKPHIVGTAIRFEGQIICFDHARETSACLACVMSTEEAEGLNCADAGVVGPVLGVIGSMMAMSAIKYVCVNDAFVTDEWQFFDGLTQRWMAVPIERRPNCECD